MWIKTQDNNELLQVVRFNIVKVFSGNQKAFLYGHFAGSSLFYSNSVLLGKYSTVEEARVVLSEIEEAIKNHEDVYQVR